MLISMVGIIILFISIVSTIILGATGLAIICISIAKDIEKELFKD